MTLIQSWKDSFKLLLPANLKLFALVTLKSIIECYKVLFRHWWWVMVIFMGITLYDLWFNLYGYEILYGVKIIGLGLKTSMLLLRDSIELLFTFFVYLTILSTRPSVAKKDFSYFNQYLGHFLYIAILLFALIVLRHWDVFPSGPILFEPINLVNIIIETFTSFNLFTFPLLVLSLLFFLDSDKRIIQIVFSFYRSIKMIVFNLPVFMVICLLMWVVFYFNSRIIDVLMDNRTMFWVYISSWYLIKVLFLTPVFACTFANIYIKKVHEQFNVYFKQPK